MLLPSMLHGRYADASRAAKRIARDFSRGVSLQGLVAGHEVEANDLPGLIVLDGPSPNIGGQAHFHAFAVSRAIIMVDQPSIEATASLRDRWFDESLRAPWSFLGLLGQMGQVLVRARRQIDFLETGIRYWDAIHELEMRYTFGIGEGCTFWRSQIAMGSALACQGAKFTSIGDAGPTTVDELRTLLVSSPGYKIRDALAEGNDDLAVGLLRAAAPTLPYIASLADHFITYDRTELALPIVRAVAQPTSTDRAAATWVSENGAGDSTLAVDDARSAFLARPDAKAWKRLKQSATEEVCAGALRELMRGEHAQIALWVHIWDGNGPKALKAWEHFSDEAGPGDFGLALVAEHVAKLIVTANPAQAAELYYISAQADVVFKKLSAYKSSVAKLQLAAAALRAAKKPREVPKMIACFRDENKRFSNLMALMDAAGL